MASGYSNYNWQTGTFNNKTSSSSSNKSIQEEILEGKTDGVLTPVGKEDTVREAVGTGGGSFQIFDKPIKQETAKPTTTTKQTSNQYNFQSPTPAPVSTFDDSEAKRRAEERARLEAEQRAKEIEMERQSIVRSEERMLEELSEKSYLQGVELTDILASLEATSGYASTIATRVGQGYIGDLSNIYSQTEQEKRINEAEQAGLKTWEMLREDELYNTLSSIEFDRWLATENLNLNKRQQEFQERQYQYGISQQNVYEQQQLASASDTNSALALINSYGASGGLDMINFQSMWQDVLGQFPNADMFALTDYYLNLLNNPQFATQFGVMQ